jgi:hypothetical protein
MLQRDGVVMVEMKALVMEIMMMMIAYCRQDNHPVGNPKRKV